MHATSRLSKSEDQEQILLGSFLGDGCIRRINGINRIRLSIIHGKKQYDYCKWKANMFGIKELNYIEKNGYCQKDAGDINKAFFVSVSISDVSAYRRFISTSVYRR